MTFSLDVTLKTLENNPIYLIIPKFIKDKIDRNSKMNKSGNIRIFKIHIVAFS